MSGDSCYDDKYAYSTESLVLDVLPSMEIFSYLLFLNLHSYLMQ